MASMIWSIKAEKDENVYIDFQSSAVITLKVPKCEIFDLFDFNDIYVIKSLKVGHLRAEIKIIIFF
jgi:hypothetical protein